MTSLLALQMANTLIDLSDQQLVWEFIIELSVLTEFSMVTPAKTVTHRQKTVLTVRFLYTPREKFWIDITFLTFF